jgi:hypothetical protein
MVESIGEEEVARAVTATALGLSSSALLAAPPSPLKPLFFTKTVKPSKFCPRR